MTDDENMRRMAAALAIVSRMMAEARERAVTKRLTTVEMAEVRARRTT